MKKLFTLLFMVSMVSLVSGQLAETITFEATGDTAYWAPFANGPGTSKANTIETVVNPASDAVNSTDSCMKFHVRPLCDNWVGMYADAESPGMNGSIASWAMSDFTGGNQTLFMLVYKTRLTECGLKFERSLNGGPDQNLYVLATMTDQWELMTFEMPETVTGYYYNRLTVFVDHLPTGVTGHDASDSTDVYIDNIGNLNSSSVKEIAGAKMLLYPNPTVDKLAVQYPGMNGIILSDVMGRQVRTMQFDVASSKVINVEHLTPGIYFVTAETTKGQYTMRFLKK
jgi:hypothetical protein